MEGLIGVEAEATLKLDASRFMQKWKDLYLRTCWYMKIRVAITLVTSIHRCIWGGKVLVS